MAHSIFFKCVALPPPLGVVLRLRAFGGLVQILTRGFVAALTVAAKLGGGSSLVGLSGSDALLQCDQVNDIGNWELQGDTLGHGAKLQHAQAQARPGAAPRACCRKGCGTAMRSTDAIPVEDRVHKEAQLAGWHPLFSWRPRGDGGDVAHVEDSK